MHKIIFILFLLIAKQALSEESQLKVGAVLYLTDNDYSNIANEFKRGLELAKNENPKKVKLIIEDDQLLNKKTVSATNKLISFDKADLLIYLEYSQVQVAGPIAERNKVPSFVIWESSPKIESIGSYIFGLGLWTPSAGATPARFAKNILNFKKAGIVYDESAWSNSVVEYFKKEYTHLHLVFPVFINI